MFPKLIFVTSIYPSVYGWSVEIKPKFIHIFFRKVLQKCPTNLVSLFETILGNPCNLTNPLKNIFATWVTSLVLKRGIKWAIFENLSTITKIESWPLWVLGSPTKKSICHIIPWSTWYWKWLTKSYILASSFDILTYSTFSHKTVDIFSHTWLIVERN